MQMKKLIILLLALLLASVGVVYKNSSGQEKNSKRITKEVQREQARKGSFFLRFTFNCTALLKTATHLMNKVSA
jgi:hypothetical protein